MMAAPTETTFRGVLASTVLLEQKQTAKFAGNEVLLWQKKKKG